MPYCSRCGVEVDDNIIKCPLCSTTIQHLPPEEDVKLKYSPKAAPHSIAPRRNKKELRKMAAILVTFGLLIPASIAISANIVFSISITWAAYTISTLIYVWVLVLLVLLYYKKPLLTLLAYYLSSLAFLYSIDYFSGNVSWFFKLAFPISTLTTIIVMVILYIANHSKVKGINILSYSVFAAAIECLGIDFSISLFLTGSLCPGWSIVILAAAIPASGLLYYIHYKTKKPLKMKEYFHI